MIKAVITGHRGFLGKHFLEKVKGEFYLHSRGGLMSSISKFQPDYIYHFAGEIYKDEEMVESNILLTYRLLEEARKLPIKAFIYIGSSSEYGRKDHPMSETDYLDPTNIYEATKGAGTLLCQAYARQYGVPVMIARPFSLYGKHEPKKRFIPTIIHSVLKGKKLQISPGVHDFIHVDDFIDGLLLLAKNPKPGEIYNFGTGVQTSNKELTEMIEEIFDIKVQKKFISSLHDYDSDCWVADNAKALELGWKPEYNLKDGLTKIINQILQEAKTHCWSKYIK